MLRAQSKSHAVHRPVGLYALIVSVLVLSIGGFFGAYNFLTDPTGASMQMTTNWMQSLPVKDYVLPGSFLLVVYGLGGLAIAYGLWRETSWAWLTALGISVVLLVWMIVQIALMGLIAPIQIVTTVLGIILLVLAMLPSVRHYYGY